MRQWHLLMVNGQAEIVVVTWLLGAAGSIDRGAHGLGPELPRLEQPHL